MNSSKEVAAMLKKWTQSNEFREFNDHMVDRTIIALEKSDFEFGDLTERKEIIVDDFVEDESEEESSEEKTFVQPESRATDNWLSF
tara:strand:- start:538 stop:795 length:258 start_codon:yes stop_codon:yes gene_type:complete